MKVPLSWLKEVVPFDQSPQEIADRLTLAGLEVEGIDDLTPPFEKVVVGKVLSTEPHPEAEKLCVATVTDGTETFQVVCGAPNCRADLITAFAQVGARLTAPDGKVTKIKKGKLRGVESQGMLCSESELGISDSHDGIAELPEDWELGSDIASRYSDIVLDIALTPNLGHCASILGVAREVAALLDSQVTMPEAELEEDPSTQCSGLTSVTVEDFELCPRYACRVITDIKVGPSPDWLKRKVEASGFRSINNVVDVTNFVLMELGHPLHAFDFDIVKDGIVVRKAKAGEKLTTLDDVERQLDEDMLVIADKEKPLALAGIMGGANSEVSDSSTKILLESAVFHPINIRRSSQRLALQSEASKRFERHVDPEMALRAMDRAAALLASVCGGKVASGFIDQKEKGFLPKELKMRCSRCNALLGTQLAIGEMESILRSLDLPCKLEGDDTLVVTIPTYRHDLNIEVDLIEEVGRIYGYDKIPRSRARFCSSPLPHSPIYLFEQEARQQLLAEGLQEFITCDLIGPKVMDIVEPESVRPEDIIQVKNPTSVDQSLLRPSLLPGLLQVVKHNIDRSVKDIAGYEVGRVHLKAGDSFKEQSLAGILLSGLAQPSSWATDGRNVDFFDLKGSVENLLEGLGVENATFVKSKFKNLHPGRQASIQIDGMAVGQIGEVHPAILSQLDIEQAVFYAEIDLHDLYRQRITGKKMLALPMFPGSERDWTLTLKEEVPASEVMDAIAKAPSKLLQDASLVTVYRSEKLGPDKKNLSFNFVYRSDKKTLSQEAVEREHKRVVDTVLSTLADKVVT